MSADLLEMIPMEIRTEVLGFGVMVASEVGVRTLPVCSMFHGTLRPSV